MSSFLASIKQFSKETEGIALPLLCLIIGVLVAASGLAVDIARQQIVQTRITAAMDAAGLAAAASASRVGQDGIQEEARKYFRANFPNGFLGVSTPDLTARLTDNNTKVRLSVTASVPTLFMGFFNQETLAITANTEVDRQSGGLEVVLALDVTGSMEGTKLTAMQTAARTMVQNLALLGGDNLWIGLVPFSQAVNIGTDKTAWLNSDHMPGNYTTYSYYNLAGSWSWMSVPLEWPVSPNGNRSTSWAGCVQSRFWKMSDEALPSDIYGPAAPVTGGYDLSDTPPNPNDAKTLFWQYYHPCQYPGWNKWTISNSGTLSCPYRCAGNARWDIATASCVCFSGYSSANPASENCLYACSGTGKVLIDGACACGPSYTTNADGTCSARCGSNATWSSSSSQCLCNETKYKKVNEGDTSCVLKCPTTGTIYNSTTNSCVCDSSSGYALGDDGITCTKKCGRNQKVEGGVCVCVNDQYEIGTNECTAKCPNGTDNYTARSGGSWTSAGGCACYEGYTFVNNTCRIVSQ